MMAKLSPIYQEAQFINGVPAVGAKIFTYAAGSTTPLPAFTDVSGGTAQSNPIILDARGEPASPIWLTEGLAYKFVFTSSTDTDPPTSPIRTIDNVTGIGDNTVTLSQWQDTGVTPVYVNANTFSVPGDQTSSFTVGRRIKAFVTAGTVYGYITSSVFTTLTTVQVELDSGNLDAGISSVQLGLLTPDDPSYPVFSDAIFKLMDDLDNTKRALFQLAAITTGTTRVLTLQDKDITVAGLSDITTALAGITTYKQTVAYGPVDINGLPNFGGATGSTTVTVAGTLTVTSTNGKLDTVLDSVNPSWTGLNTNGINYLYIDTVTGVTGSTTLAPVYQFGGSYSITNNQHTYDTQEAIMKVGNGTVANQVNRVFVGQVLVAANVVSTITWYAVRGNYDSNWTATLPTTATAVQRTHNIGRPDIRVTFIMECTSVDANYAVGDRLTNQSGTNAAYADTPNYWYTPLTCGFTTSANGSWVGKNKNTGATTPFDITKWRYKIVATAA